MAKIWKQGDIIPLARINELEEIAEAYKKMIAKQKDAPKGPAKKPATKE